jgi:hypothetical protein
MGPDLVCFHLQTASTRNKVRVQPDGSHRSFPPNSQMTTPPSSPPFHVVLQALQNDFGLSEEQLAALPPLDEVELIPQTDSHLIQHVETKVFTYHPYKLFVGENNGEPFHAYLTRNGERKQYKIELCSVDAKNETTYEPMEAGWFGTVNNLAYPFNTFLGKARFVAVVKWYFMLAFRAGEYDEDPGFAVTATWQNDLKGACGELIAASHREQQKEQQTKIKDLEKKADILKRAIAKKNRESEGTAEQQATESQHTNLFKTKAESQAGESAQRKSSRPLPTPSTDPEGGNVTTSQRPRQPKNRRTSYPPHAVIALEKSRGLQPLPQHRAIWDLEGSRLHSPYDPAVRHPVPPTPYQYEPFPRPYSRPGGKEWMIQRMLKGRGQYRQSDDGVVQNKTRFIEHAIVPTDERPTRRRKSGHTAKDDKTDVVDGNKKDEDPKRMSWTQEVDQLAPSVEDREEDEMKAEEVETDDSVQAERERKWMQLFRTRAEMLQQMHRLEDEMDVNERLDLFDKVKYV